MSIGENEDAQAWYDPPRHTTRHRAGLRGMIPPRPLTHELRWFVIGLLLQWALALAKPMRRDPIFYDFAEGIGVATRAMERP